MPADPNADHSKPPCASPIAITPSPTSCATVMPFGPLAATRTGVPIGRSGTKPGGWTICTSAPSTSTASPRRRAFNARTYAATSAHVSGRWPSRTRPVKPVPTMTATRPGASASSVAIVDAVTIT